MDVKPKIDPVTGCAHIENFHGYKLFRVCSKCSATVPEGIDEGDLNYCWNCGATFDHTDDEPEEE